MRLRLTPHRQRPPGSSADERQDAVALARDSSEEYLAPWTRAAQRLGVSWTLLKLAWTAGPVTGIGLYGGYYFAYGVPPNAELLIYFITFTVLSGLIGLSANFIYESTRGAGKEQAQAELITAIDQLGELILSVRDLNVASLEGNARRGEAARQLLRRVDLSPDGVALACEELTDDRELGRILARIDTYRRAGLYSRIRDLNARHAEHFEATIEQLKEEAPLAASALRARYAGEVPNLRAGIPRKEAFIERARAATEQDNPLLLTMGDVEEILGLAFELLTGREIPILTFNFRGSWRLARAFDALETARSRFRLAQAASDNRIRALAGWLVEAGVLPYETASEELPANTLLQRASAAMNRLQRRVDALQERLRRTPGDREAYQELAKAADTLATAVALYRSAREAVRMLGTTHAELLNAAEAWERLTQQRRRADSQLRLGQGRRGLRIVERTLSLSEEAREAVARDLMHHLRGATLERGVHPGPAQRSPKRPTLPTTADARRLATEVALALEPYIHLSRPEVQRGLGATRGIYLGDLEPGMSVQEKRSLAAAMAEEVEEDFSRAAEQLAVALVRHYQVELTDRARAFLQRTYGARPQVLAAIARSQQGDEEGERGAQAISLLSRRPTPIPPPRRDWYRSLVRARRMLNF